MYWESSSGSFLQEKSLKPRYCKLGNFHIKNNSREKLLVIKFSWFRSIHEIFLMVDDCNMDNLPGSSWHLVYTTRYQESKGLLAVGFDRTFTSRNVDLHVNLITDHRHVILFFAC